MVEKLYIPTLGRVNNQKSYDGLPDKWKRKTYLVVQDQEYDEYEGFYNVIRLPKRLSGEYGRCSNAKAYIITELDNDCMYGILDDDLNYVYTEMHVEVVDEICDFPFSDNIDPYTASWQLFCATQLHHFL